MSVLTFFVAISVVTAAPARAFVPLYPPIQTAYRWSAANHPSVGGRGLYDGIAVAVAPNFAEDLLTAILGSATPADVADVEDAVRAAFAAWESPVLAFAVTFDGGAVRGESLGAEIDLFVVPGTDPAFAVAPAAFGITFLYGPFEATRLLTNGTVLGGYVNGGSDIFLNTTNIAPLAAVFPDRDDQKKALQRLLMHEIGHALGLHHPNEFVADNLDSNGDPYDLMVVDPFDPFGGLLLSPAIDVDAVMTNRPVNILSALFFTEIRNDDRAGRDVLYPALPTSVCPPVPRTRCRRAGTSALSVKAGRDPSRDKLVWKWTKGAATTLADFGSPQTTRAFGLCLYSAAPAKHLDVVVPSDGTRWGPAGSSGLTYVVPAGASGDVRKLQMKAGVAGKAAIKVTGMGAPFAAALGGIPAPVTIQLADDESAVCYESVFAPADVIVNDAGRLKAKVSP